MEPGTIFFQLFVLLMTGLLGGLLALRLRQPVMLGELAAGLFVGHAAVYFFPSRGLDSTTLSILSEIGICALLFDVGLKIHLNKIRAIGSEILLVAIVGVITPFALGYFAAFVFGLPKKGCLLIAVSLTATSVGVTAAILEEVNKAVSRIGNIIASAAILDDILGLIVLSFITGVVSGKSSSMASFFVIGTKVVVFFGIALFLLRPLASRALDALETAYGEKGVTLASFSFLLFLSFASDIVGLGLIVGAFTAGLALSEARERDEIHSAFRPIVNIFAGLFFVLIGTQMNLFDLCPLSKDDAGVLLFGGVLVVSAIAGKLMCGLAVRGSTRDKWTVGFGMVPRGEVVLIIANLGRSEGILQQAYFSVLILVVMITTFFGSSLFKHMLANSKNH
ncbi:MAG: cation:proton antiporter [Candidatus Bathyarchaeota archaeon]|nr:cation:proton antiporter [Candidatus Bathyarchaeota archaeon]